MLIQGTPGEIHIKDSDDHIQVIWVHSDQTMYLPVEEIQKLSEALEHWLREKHREQKNSLLERNTVTQRRMVSYIELLDITDDLMQEWAQAGREFTNYDLRQELRLRHPKLEIDAGDVRAASYDVITAAQGNAAHPLDGWRFENRDYNGNQARTFTNVPVPTLVQKVKNVGSWLGQFFHIPKLDSEA